MRDAWKRGTEGKERNRGKREGREREKFQIKGSIQSLLRIYNLVSSCLPETGHSYLLNAELINSKFIRDPAPHISVEDQKAVALGLALNLLG